MKYGELVGIMQGIDLVAKANGLNSQDIVNLEIKEIVDGNRVEDVSMNLELGKINERGFAIVATFSKNNIIVTRS